MCMFMCVHLADDLCIEIRFVYSLPLFTLPEYVFTLPALPSTTEPSSPARSRQLPCQRGRQQYGPPVTVWF